MAKYARPAVRIEPLPLSKNYNFSLTRAAVDRETPVVLSGCARDKIQRFLEEDKIHAIRTEEFFENSNRKTTALEFKFVHRKKKKEKKEGVGYLAPNDIDANDIEQVRQQASSTSRNE